MTTPQMRGVPHSKTTVDSLDSTDLLENVQDLCLVVPGASDLYSNSFISPSSSSHLDIQWRPERAIQSAQIESTSGPDEDAEDIEGTPVANSRVQRSAEPILSKTSAGDDLLLHKNIEDTLDSNDVELSGRLGHVIQPSRTANPDIQDIITGIVKLLNGNVNVQANTAPGMGRPLRPLSTRINNRGPPRITDVPALPPDFDVPAPPMAPPPLGRCLFRLSPTGAQSQRLQVRWSPGLLIPSTCRPPTCRPNAPIYQATTY
ncbi:hypothetical protein YQE_04132, partial [Dendroctonus ponderosae]